jgi:hypothetical protein
MARRRDRERRKEDKRINASIENKMIRTRNLIREVGYQLDEIMRSE